VFTGRALVTRAILGVLQVENNYDTTSGALSALRLNTGRSIYIRIYTGIHKKCGSTRVVITLENFDGF